jgi:hypothetical protein
MSVAIVKRDGIPRGSTDLHLAGVSISEERENESPNPRSYFSGRLWALHR